MPPLISDSIDKSVQRVRKALTAAEESETVDPVMRILLPIFTKKFDSLATTPAQIRWCAENNLIQQALTIYTDRLPRYLIENRKLLTLPMEPESYFQSIIADYADGNTGRDRSLDEIKAFKSKDRYNYVWNDMFLWLGKDKARRGGMSDFAVATIQYLGNR